MLGIECITPLMVCLQAGQGGVGESVTELPSAPTHPVVRV